VIGVLKKVCDFASTQKKRHQDWVDRLDASIDELDARRRELEAARSTLGEATAGLQSLARSELVVKPGGHGSPFSTGDNNAKVSALPVDSSQVGRVSGSS